MQRKAALIAYDVSSNRRRRRLRRCLQSWSLDGQYSVFECRLTRREAEELFLQLTEQIDSETDNLLLAWLDDRRRPRELTRAATIGFQVPAWYAG